MKTSVEQFPIELWISIFSYLEVHDIYQAFTDLNSYFNKLLLSQHLSFYLQLRKNDSIDSHWSDTLLNRIICLRTSTPSRRPDYFLEFLQFHAHKLARLQSLIIEIYIAQSHIIQQIIQGFHSLEYLSIICHITPSLCEAIFGISTLRVCHLEVQKVTDITNYNSNKTSNLRTLYIVYSKISDYSFINVLLSHMPKLKRLNISDHFWCSFNTSLLFTHPLSILPELRIIKLKSKYNFNCLTSSFLERLYSIMPNVKYFYLNINYRYLNDFLSNNLYNDWWPILKKMKKFKIIIRGHKEMCDDINMNIRKGLDNDRQILLSKINQYENRYEIQWIEKEKKSVVFINISITNL